MKNFVKAISRSMGLYMRLQKNIPFGVEWCQDVKYLLGDKDLELVVDVGANIGQTAYEVLKYFPKSCIYSFEPIPTTFKQLVERTKAFPNVFQVNAALGDQPSTSPMTAKPLAQQNTLVFDVKEARQNHIETAVVEKLSACQALTDVDPVVWQRQTRQDRSLPGR
jgi:FkbM family methyltransferase